MKQLSLIISLLLIAGIAYSQQKGMIQVLSAGDKMPVAALVVNEQNELIVMTDTAGRCIIPEKQLKKQEELYIKSIGYTTLSINTVGLASVTVYLKPTAIEMKEAVITTNVNTTPRRVLKAYSESIVDFDISREGMMLAAFGGTSGKKGKLIFLNHDRDTIAYQPLPFRPVSLFRTCDNELYVESFADLYKVTVSDNQLTVTPMYLASTLPDLQRCQQCVNGHRYFKRFNDFEFYTEYTRQMANDTVARPFFTLYDDGANMSSKGELASALNMLGQGMFIEAQHILRTRKFLDRYAIEVLDQSLFTRNDSIILFDLFHKVIRYFTTDGREVKTIALALGKTAPEKLRVIKDPVSCKFYMQHNTLMYHSLDEIDMETGQLYRNRMIVKKPFVDCLKVYDGSVYYVWQPGNPVTRRQLYMEQ